MRLSSSVCRTEGLVTRTCRHKHL